MLKFYHLYISTVQERAPRLREEHLEDRQLEGRVRAPRPRQEVNLIDSVSLRLSFIIVGAWCRAGALSVECLLNA